MKTIQETEDVLVASKNTVCLNPADEPKGPYYSSSPCEYCQVPFEERIVIDPETMDILHLEDHEQVPRTSGRCLSRKNGRMAQPASVCLGVTRACNLACRYCYVRNRPEIKEAGFMSLETAKNALLMCNPKGISISFFGGEPLLAFGFIQEVVRWVKGKGRFTNPRFHVTTNGVLMTKEIAKFLADHNFSLIVSLDGPKEIHDFNRPRLQKSNGRDTSHDKTMAALEILKGAGVSKRITLRSTYTKDSRHIAERVAFLNELVWNGFAGHVSVESVTSSETSCIDPTLGKSLGFGFEDALELKEDYAEAFDWVLNQVKAGKSIRWHHLNHFARRILKRQPSLTECGAAKGYFHVTPTGDMIACHREAGPPIGHVDEGFDERERAQWMDNRYYVRKNCPKCWCRTICGGGCRADSIVHMGDIRQPYPTSCITVQIIIANIITLITQLSLDEQKLIL